MKKATFGVLAAAALTFGWSGPASAQQDAEGWWRPVATTTEDGRPSVRDVILGRRGDTRDDRAREGDRSGSWNPFPTRDRDGRYEDEGRRGKGAKKGNGNGSVHCRSGQGHPVHGRQWCAGKGWTGEWDRAGWRDVIFRGQSSTRDRRMSQPSVMDVLGDVVFGRLSRLGQDAGLSGAVDGRWLRLPDAGSVLQLRMGGVPLAELADVDLDGRADLVMLSRIR